MTNLSSISTGELEDELERRKSIEEAKPKERFDKNWDDVIRFCNLHLDCIARRSGYEGNKEYIYEEAMKAVFGEKVFDFVYECEMSTED